MKSLIYLILTFLLFGCGTKLVGTFKSSKLTSSQGESIFVNSLNWGVTDDSQLTSISVDSLKLKNNRDTLGTVYGLNPFIYSFNNDSLTLFFYDTISYKIIDNFQTISVNYIIVNSSEFLKLNEKALNNQGFYSVPDVKNIAYPKDMPLPPK
jgi:hypothetical protein